MKLVLSVSDRAIIMKWHYVSNIVGFCVVVCATRALCDVQEDEFINLVKNLVQGDELKTIQNVYSALPVELRDKLGKDLLANPALITQQLGNLLGPQVQNLMQNLGGLDVGNLLNLAKTLNPEAPKKQKNAENADSKKIKKEGKPAAAGFDFGQIASTLGNLVGNNPDLLNNVIERVGQMAGGKQGFNPELLMNMLSQQVDMETVMNMASAFGALPSSQGSHGHGVGKLQQVMQWWGEFIKSPAGERVNRILPQLTKVSSLPDALRIIETEMSFKFDTLLRQVQDADVRQQMSSRVVQQVKEYFRGSQVPTNFATVISTVDNLLTNQIGLGPQAKSYIEPVQAFLKDKFKIGKGSLLDMSPTDIEQTAKDVISNDVLEPMSSVWDAYQKALDNPKCAQFIYCQLNNNFYSQNCIRKYAIKTSSVISAFQASSSMKKDAFNKIYESIYHGADGFDCTHGAPNHCLELMDTTAHNEL